ncbi:hypothetical protein [Clostridium cylindrosporum]|uniref:Uncharacterized protein n=1 Tax=Clostridium cylindrosporum DSM 605 TaxID=1121307 RepID=A0A0J8DBP8_CLOCY|nr:hypothetical protein [Clostridium cylindrosporum]KMT21734.1 hypothetical protein CLCY_3c00010 [Clostridium cylindrosporum DSM 605]
MKSYASFQGRVKSIEDFPINQSGKDLGCYKFVSLIDNNDSIVNFIVSPTTYFVDHVMIKVGDIVTGFYDRNAPVPLIYPPQYRALIMAKNTHYQNVKVDYFNSNLISSDGMLKLNIAPYTSVILENGQEFTKCPINRNLIVVYGPTTKSIPAQTTPYKIVVICDN